MKLGLLIVIVLIVTCAVNVQASSKKKGNKKKGANKKKPAKPKNEINNNIVKPKNEINNNIVKPKDEPIKKTVRFSDEPIGNTLKPKAKQNDNIKSPSTESTSHSHKEAPKDHGHFVSVSTNNNNITNITNMTPIVSNNIYPQSVNTHHSPLNNQMRSSPQLNSQPNSQPKPQLNPQHPLHNLPGNSPKDDDIQLTSLEREILEIAKEINHSRYKFKTTRNIFNEAELECKRLTFKIKELNKGLKNIKLLCGLNDPSIFKTKSSEKAKDFLHACYERETQKELLHKSFSKFIKHKELEDMALNFLTQKVGGYDSNGEIKDSKKLGLEQSTADLSWEYYQKLLKTIESEDKEILEMKNSWDEIFSIALKEMNNK